MGAASISAAAAFAAATAAVTGMAEGGDATGGGGAWGAIVAPAVVVARAESGSTFSFIIATTPTEGGMPGLWPTGTAAGAGGGAHGTCAPFADAGGGSCPPSIAVSFCSERPDRDPLFKPSKMSSEQVRSAALSHSHPVVSGFPSKGRAEA